QPRHAMPSHRPLDETITTDCGTADCERETSGRNCGTINRDKTSGPKCETADGGSTILQARSSSVSQFCIFSVSSCSLVTKLGPAVLSRSFQPNFKAMTTLSEVRWLGWRVGVALLLVCASRAAAQNSRPSPCTGCFQTEVLARLGTTEGPG